MSGIRGNFFSRYNVISEEERRMQMKTAVKKFLNRFTSEEGFTLIELMIVIAIIGILAIAVVPKFMDLPQKARIQRAKQDIAAISMALNRYNLDNGGYPTTEQGLSALIEKPTSDPAPTNYNESGYLEKKTLPKDPWNHPYVYKSPADNGEAFEVTSLGPDGKEGGPGIIKGGE
jgi:general secretion pathway protein G